MLQYTNQVDSAFYSPWDGKMSTSQRAVMFCGWGVKAGMVQIAGKTVWSMSERIWDGLRKNALYKSTYTLLYFTNHRVVVMAMLSCDIINRSLRLVVFNSWRPNTVALVAVVLVFEVAVVLFVVAVAMNTCWLWRRLQHNERRNLLHFSTFRLRTLPSGGVKIWLEFWARRCGSGSLDGSRNTPQKHYKWGGGTPPLHRTKSGEGNRAEKIWNFSLEMAC